MVKTQERRYVVELVHREVTADLEELGARARSGARALTAEGTPVRYLRMIFIPEDATCLLVYEGPSAEVVRAAAARAGLPLRASAAIPLS